MNPTALIAEDEPLLAQALQGRTGRRLARPARSSPPPATVAAPCARRCACCRRCCSSTSACPVCDGLGAAAELADCWPADEAPMPQLVFVTAYDEYAARAFDDPGHRLRAQARPARTAAQDRQRALQQALAAPRRPRPPPSRAALERTLGPVAPVAGRCRELRPGPQRRAAAGHDRRQRGRRRARCAWSRSTRCCISRRPTSTSAS